MSLLVRFLFRTLKTGPYLIPFLFPILVSSTVLYFYVLPCYSLFFMQFEINSCESARWWEKSRNL